MAECVPVKVAVRVRPLTAMEVDMGCRPVVNVPGAQKLICGPKRYQYDHVFGQTQTQEEIYNEAVAGLVNGLFQGLNATVLGYGQTGSGKTYCLFGKKENEMGIIPRVVRNLFQQMKSKSATADFVLKCSFFELHNDDIFDLLKDDKVPLSMRVDTKGEIKITGLSEIVVHQERDLIALLEKGSARRTTGSTAMNATSSRSHAIFAIHLEQYSKDDRFPTHHAEFHLVDLAGSERAKRSQAQGGRFQEGVNINMGLLILGNVIRALGDNKQHIPYRDSKLTRLLKDSLGGNSQTLMIACVSPADSNMEETLNTLRYADRARKIKNKPVVNKDTQVAKVARSRGQVEQLQHQLPSSSGVLPPVNPPSERATKREKQLEEKVTQLEDQLKTSKEKIKVLEGEKRALSEKVTQLERQIETFKEKEKALSEQPPKGKKTDKGAKKIEYITTESSTSGEEKEPALKDEDWVATPQRYKRRKISKVVIKEKYCKCKSNCGHKKCGCSARGTLCVARCHCKKDICKNLE